jgi:hypothetical protein
VQLASTAGETNQWTGWGSNTPTIHREKQGANEEGAVKSAVNPGNFAEAVAAIMRLPLSDADKAEAVRRLLRGDAGGSGGSE